MDMVMGATPHHRTSALRQNHRAILRRYLRRAGPLRRLIEIIMVDSTTTTIIVR